MLAQQAFLLLTFTLTFLGCGTPNSQLNEIQRSPNFIISGTTKEFADLVASQAEAYLRSIALDFTGEEPRPLTEPVEIRVIANNAPAQGVTQYNREPIGAFRMEVVGTQERILDSILPHEITHVILALYFNRTLPRWADEALATTVENPIEQEKHWANLSTYLRTKRGIPINRLFLATEYPEDILPFYAQSFGVTSYLIGQREDGKKAIIKTVKDYMRGGSWTEAFKHNFGYPSLANLQESWISWLAQREQNGGIVNSVPMPKESPVDNNDFVVYVPAN